MRLGKFEVLVPAVADGSNEGNGRGRRICCKDFGEDIEEWVCARGKIRANLQVSRIKPRANNHAFGGIVAWLTIVSRFDLRKGEVPHSAWVVVPLVFAAVYRAWQGDWQLVVLATLVALVSEREHIVRWIHLGEAGRVITWLPLVLLALSWSA